MPIIIRKQNSNSTVTKEEYINEKELQEILADNPELLMSDHEPKVKLVKREVFLGSAGILDLLLVDSEGRPTVVEVKLSRNSESRREVVGQVFDYVSELTQRTVDEIDMTLDGKLGDVIQSFCIDDEDTYTFDKLWRSCGANLRSGQVRVVIAIDEASEDLIRIVRFINDHSDIDVRLVSINKYVKDDNEMILVPKLIVHGGKHAMVKGSIDSKFQDVILAYEKIACKGFEPRGKARKYRLIYPDNWGDSVHYEFLDGQDEIGVEIHLENDNVSSLINLFKSFEAMLGTLFQNAEIILDSKWSKNKGRLRVVFKKSCETSIIAEAMKILIEKTKNDIESNLRKLSII